jgi:hypothetical protein
VHHGAILNGSTEYKAVARSLRQGAALASEFVTLQTAAAPP